MLLRQFAISAIAVVSLQMWLVVESRRDRTTKPPRFTNPVSVSFVANPVAKYRPTYRSHRQPPHTRRSSPAVVANQRHEGNFYRKAAVFAEKPKTDTHIERPPALYDHEVLHYEPDILHKAYRRRRQSTAGERDPEQSEEEFDEISIEDEPSNVYADNDDDDDDDDYDEEDDDEKSIRKSALHDQNTERPQHPDDDEDAHERETRYFHDIFMRFASAASRSDSSNSTPSNGEAVVSNQLVIPRVFGHIEQSPRLLEQRMETVEPEGNRYRGEVIWTDSSGGYGEHRWDMAQGKL